MAIKQQQNWARAAPVVKAQAKQGVQMKITNSNTQLAILTLEHLGFSKSIDWQQAPDYQIARWRRGDLLVTLLLRCTRLTLAFTSATYLSVPTQRPLGMAKAVEALMSAGVVFKAMPEGGV